MKSSPIFFIVVATTIIANWKYAKYVVAAILIIAAFKFIQKILIFAVSLFENFRLKEVDAMGGIEFEKHVGKILRNNGYTNIHFTEKYDYGQPGTHGNNERSPITSAMSLRSPRA